MDNTSKEPTEVKEEEKKEGMPEKSEIGKDEPVYHDIGEDEEEEEKSSST